jgi:MOSC domain-containing protein YiiM
VIDELKALGFPVFPGALGENLTTRGLDYRAWHIGQRWRIGTDAVVEFTKVRTPCQSLLVYGAGIHAAIYDAQVNAGDPLSPKWGWSGMYASVITPGAIRSGDSVVVQE